MNETMATGDEARQRREDLGFTDVWLLRIRLRFFLQYCKSYNSSLNSFN